MCCELSQLVETLIEAGEGEKVFTKAIQNQGRGQILGTLAEIQERHEAVKDLEKKLLELHQVDFSNITILISFYHLSHRELT